LHKYALGSPPLASFIDGESEQSWQFVSTRSLILNLSTLGTLSSGKVVPAIRTGYRFWVVLDFLGYTFRYDRPRQGRRDTAYLNVVPSKKALAREREKLRTLIATNQGHTPLPQLVAKLNRHLEGWANYFCYGYPRGAWWETGSSEAV
jgi:hypothetical protein